jgi:hypothetical protein
MVVMVVMDGDGPGGSTGVVPRAILRMLGRWPPDSAGYLSREGLS